MTQTDLDFLNVWRPSHWLGQWQCKSLIPQNGDTNSIGHVPSPKPHAWKTSPSALEVDCLPSSTKRGQKPGARPVHHVANDHHVSGSTKVSLMQILTLVLFQQKKIGQALQPLCRGDSFHA